MRKRLAGLLSALLLAGGLSLVGTVPSQAAEASQFRICRSSGAFTDIEAYLWPYHDWSQLLHSDGSCTGWLIPEYIRVDTDPNGASHSYKLKVTDANGNGGSYGPCHTNSDNHASDPPNPGTNPTRVYYRNYDHGDCTN